VSERHRQEVVVAHQVQLQPVVVLKALQQHGRHPGQGLRASAILSVRSRPVLQGRRAGDSGLAGERPFRQAVGLSIRDRRSAG
jgi:hypothetical protein